ncbi:hypothetical protein IW139_000368 [Coemansia sp. RSA 353]|nr:hypothetical protein GGH17_000353 [Coemansia sp. RSA 788]KAJ2168841.1 hypothetical protein GGH15_001046 [Coemansia sp. RSA 562]KAJ2191611.1 hypothetical protein EV181_000126 [Coemansia sp. RSA 532]KAJ2199669.1 hypothetical protein GGH18_000369 [Coemansia sp. RSA 530]KAJ2201069.1 hypothetical protein IW144_000619 [Coemansia sp. RSA 522]KAJ2209093.1 hypothetical protein IW145_000205 [Coemansia sp. RSA 521]KAJ2231635.1 hypothetical protein EV180_000242 [Coemansia sp. RSA 518]KAJ2250789.1 hyp
MSTEAAPSYDSKIAGTSYAPPVPPNNQKPIVFDPPKFGVTHPIQADNAYDTFMDGLGSCIGFFGQIPCCFCCPNPYKSVQQGSIGLVSRFGRYYKTVDPGLAKVNPCSEDIAYVDTKVQIAPISDLTIVTKDNVSVTIDTVLYWHVTDPYLATYGVSNVKQALVERTQTTLRAVLGGQDLQELIENRSSIASAITAYIDKPARDWGVAVESMLIKDVSMSKELQTSLSSAATQRRIGESKVIQAKAEVDAAMLMREAAEILNTPAAMQIRTLDSMVMMAKTANTKVMFVPVNQDYSNGSINAFGGAGATVGINAYAPGDGPGKSNASLEDRKAALPIKFPNDKQPEHFSSSPISSSVKDAAIFSQITDM